MEQTLNPPPEAIETTTATTTGHVSADTGFHNPYPAARDSHDWRRISIDVDGRDVDLIKSVLVRHGSLQTAVNLYVKSLASYVRNNQFTLADANTLERSIVGFNKQLNDARIGFVVAGQPTYQPDRQEPSGHDGCGTGPLREGSQSKANVATPIVGEQTSPKGKGGKSGKGTKSKQASGTA